MMSYERSCRLCLTDLNEAPVDCSSIPELYETVKVLFDVQILRTDNIRAICNRCLDYVMGYRAIKKKITECQKIIEDFEEVRKKVMETRNIARAITIKQEIIDVDAFECSVPDVQSTTINYVCPRPKAVTDSEINDILALVHDKSTKKHSISARSIQKRMHSKVKPIKTERQSQLRMEIENRSPSLEPISSTSNNVVEKNQMNDERSLPPEVPSRDYAGDVKKHRQEPASPVDVPADTVSSSVRTPSELDDKQHTTRKRRLTNAKSPAKGKRVQDMSPKPANSPSTRQSLQCTLCSAKLRSNASLKSHLQEKHKMKPAEPEKPKAEPSLIRKIKKENSTSLNSSAETSIRRSLRQAKSKAMKQISPKPDTSPSKGRQLRVKKFEADTPNNSIVEPQQTSTPMAVAAVLADDKSALLKNQSIKSENSSANISESSYLKDTSLNKSEKKRIITITLVRTKECLNFRYCDQFKRNIEFQSVSPDELEDIRKSLMIPEIWANLREAFKNSPPDVRTIGQLKTILGDNFVL